MVQNIANKAMDGVTIRFLLACAVLVAQSPAQQQSDELRRQPNPNRLLKISVAVDKKAYKLGEKVVVTSQIMNTSGKPVVVPEQMVPGRGVYTGFAITLSDKDGHEPQSGLAGDVFWTKEPPGITEQLQMHSLVLVPGGFLGLKHSIETGIYKNLRPGRYKILVAYRSWPNKEIVQVSPEVVRDLEYEVATDTYTAEPLWIEIQ